MPEGGVRRCFWPFKWLQLAGEGGLSMGGCKNSCLLLRL